jgi:hypothetical protein
MSTFTHDYPARRFEITIILRGYANQFSSRERFVAQTRATNFSP